MDEEQIGGLRMTGNYPDDMDWGAYDDYFEGEYEEDEEEE